MGMVMMRSSLVGKMESSTDLKEEVNNGSGDLGLGGLDGRI